MTTKRYDWMVKYTPQTEWIEQRGILLWLAFFFIELGAGMFFIASLFHNLAAMITGWIICGALGGGTHLLYLGKPLRFWRMLFSSGWKTSWISRGLGFVSFFLLLGLIGIIISFAGTMPIALVVATNVFAFLTIIYGGFAMNYVVGIRLWNTALLPILFVISGLWGGAEVSMGITVATGSVSTGVAIEEWIRILLIGFVLIIPVYLISVRYTSLSGEASVLFILGKWSPLFWLGVIILGMVIPLTAVINSFIIGLEQTPPAFLYAAILSGLLGDLATRYIILRCGLYCPLIPSSGQAV